MQRQHTEFLVCCEPKLYFRGVVIVCILCFQGYNPALGSVQALFVRIIQFNGSSRPLILLDLPVILTLTLFAKHNLFLFQFIFFKVKYIALKLGWISNLSDFFRIFETFRGSVKRCQCSDELFYYVSDRCIYFTWHMLYLQHRCLASNLHF